MSGYKMVNSNLGYCKVTLFHMIELIFLTLVGNKCFMDYVVIVILGKKTMALEKGDT